MALAILSYTSPTFTIPHAMSFTPLIKLMGGGNNPPKLVLKDMVKKEIHIHNGGYFLLN